MSYEKLGVVAPGNCRSVEHGLPGGRRKIGRHKNVVQLHFQGSVHFRHSVSASIEPPAPDVLSVNAVNNTQPPNCPWSTMTPRGKHLIGAPNYEGCHSSIGFPSGSCSRAKRPMLG